MSGTQRKLDRQAGTGRTGHDSLGTSLAGSVLRFDLATEIEELRREPSWQQADHNAKTLVKHSGLRIVLILLKAGAVMREHKADAQLSVHALRGRLRLHLSDQVVELPPGCLLALEGGLMHEVEAVEESAFLLSLSWPEGNRPEGNRPEGNARTSDFD
jgi:quercetin dioxygenase-like cupin family protein